jgi:hypothetical protein
MWLGSQLLAIVYFSGLVIFGIKKEKLLRAFHFDGIDAMFKCIEYHLRVEFGKVFIVHANDCAVFKKQVVHVSHALDVNGNHSDFNNSTSPSTQFYHC